MSRFPGAEIGADELPDEVHVLADRIETITGKDVYFIDARRHRFEPGQLPPGQPPPAVSGPPSGADIVVFVNPDGVPPPILSNNIRRFLIQALLVWEGYPIAGLRPVAPDEMTAKAIAEAVGPLQHWMHMGLLGTAAESKLAELFATAPEPRRASRLPPPKLPPALRQKLIDFESAMALTDRPPAVSAGADAIAEILGQADVNSALGFRAASSRILELWGVRQHVILGVADKESGAINEVPW